MLYKVFNFEIHIEGRFRGGATFGARIVLMGQVFLELSSVKFEFLYILPFFHFRHNFFIFIGRAKIFDRRIDVVHVHPWYKFNYNRTSRLARGIIKRQISLPGKTLKND